MDANRLRDSFAQVARYGDEVALFLYSELFLRAPEVRDLFPVSMSAQRDRLLGALGRIVSDVDALDSLVPFLQGLGRDHRKFGTIAEHYDAVGISLLVTLAHFSGSNWTYASTDDLHPDDSHVHAVNVLAKVQQTADRYVADAQEYSREMAEDARRRRDELLTEARSRAAMVLEDAHNDASRAAAAVPASAEPLSAVQRQELQAELAYLRTFSDVCRTHRVPTLKPWCAISRNGSRPKDRRWPPSVRNFRTCHKHSLTGGAEREYWHRREHLRSDRRRTGRGSRGR